MSDGMSTAEVARRLNCTPRHIRNLIADGLLEAVDIGRKKPKLRVTEQDLDAYLERQRVRVSGKSA